MTTSEPTDPTSSDAGSTRRRDHAPVLVIGVGSELRCDDAAGRRVAERLAEGRHPDLEVLSVTQTTPELAAAMTGRRLVVIVDAAVGIVSLRTDRVAADPGTGAISHHLDVAALLRYAELLGDPPLEVVTVAVPAFDLSLGTELSRGAEAGVEEAIAVVARLRQGEPGVGGGDDDRSARSRRVGSGRVNDLGQTPGLRAASERHDHPSRT